VLVLCLLHLVPAAAEQPAPTPTPTPTPAEYLPYTLGEITVTADAPAVDRDLDVMTAEEIEAANARTVAEAWRTCPAAGSSRKNEPNVSIHGFDQSKILVLIDGVPYYETNYGKLDLNQIPTAIIARIEVSKGAASVLYGANAMGGVVNIVTKRAGDVPFTGATVEAGENGLRNLLVTHVKLTTSYWANTIPGERRLGWRTTTSRMRAIVTGGEQHRPHRPPGNEMRTNSDVDRDDAWLKPG
jgi:iron complex outermembrane receptor protein